VNFAQHVLQLLEIVAPGGVLIGKEILDNVPEPFKPDAL
jgi:hypothetical protein